MNELKSIIESIKPLDTHAMAEASARQDQLTKPQGSLGVLEAISIRLAGIQRKPLPKLTKSAVVVMAADHGVAASGVSAFPQEVTAQMVLNFLNKGAAINAIAGHVGADVKVVDIGVASELNIEALIQRKVRAGSSNIHTGPAMTREECLQAINAGIELVRDLAKHGYDILATGEMGIANTTPSAAIVHFFSGRSLDDVVGRGTGIDDEHLKIKKDVIKEAIELNAPDAKDPIDVLSKIGGLDIAGLCGVILGASECGIPVVIDGFISGAAALVAAKISTATLDYMFASHVSQEPGHKITLEMLDLRPMLFMDMRLGEGTGAAIGISICEMAAKVLAEMATFEQAMVSNKKLLETAGA